jgi:hypothetical protein
MQNRKLATNRNRLGVLGVHYRWKKYHAEITRGGKKVLLGKFDTAEDANRAYHEARIMYEQGVAI